ncbi:MAG: methylmalonyl Co-A mutase-associated GTPase MeaB [Actinomycetota bacterium]
MSELARQVLAGDRRALARSISLVEDDGPDLRELVAVLGAETGQARIVGLTGSPGAGKSTLTSALVSVLRKDGLKVAILAIDPSSPFTGGALLGDRLRMQEHATDEAVFIRSMATRGALGGLAVAVPHALRILDAAGFDVILLETVGVGQAEVEVANAADTTVVVLAPGMGDSVQANKAGILEIADVFAVNKADKPEAKQTERDIRHMLQLGHGDWLPPIEMVIAQDGTGVGSLWQRVDEHRDWASGSGELARRRLRRAAHEITELALANMRRNLGTLGEGAALDDLAEQVVRGSLDPYSAAEQLASASGDGPSKI